MHNETSALCDAANHIRQPLVKRWKRRAVLERRLERSRDDNAALKETLVAAFDGGVDDAMQRLDDEFARLGRSGHTPKQR